MRFILFPFLFKILCYASICQNVNVSVQDSSQYEIIITITHKNWKKQIRTDTIGNILNESQIYFRHPERQSIYPYNTSDSILESYSISYEKNKPQLIYYYNYETLTGHRTFLHNNLIPLIIYHTELSFYETDVKNGNSIQYYDNGIPSGVTFKYKDEDTLRMIAYSRSGNITAYDKYIENRLIEVFIRNDAFGKPLDKGSFKNGDGTVILYDSSSFVMATVNFKNGYRDGPYITFYEYPNDTAMVDNYSNGMRHGEYKIYYRNGKLQEISNYEYGSLKGKFIRYDENGNIVSEKEY